MRSRGPFRTEQRGFQGGCVGLRTNQDVSTLIPVGGEGVERLSFPIAEGISTPNTVFSPVTSHPPVRL